MFFKKLSAALAALLFAPAPALAADWYVEVRVNAVEMTYAPDRVTFWVDGPAGTCVVAQNLGTQLTWTARGTSPEKLAANGQAALATLLTARATNRSVKIFGRNADCQIEFMYLT